MDVEQARAILGVDVETDGDAIRRAYLRAVKQHPPERDPEGFQRVRQAFELLSVRPQPLDVAFPSPSSALLDQFWAEPDPAAQDALFEQLVEAHGDDPEVRWLEYDRADAEAAPDVARRSDDPSMLREAMVQHPDAFSDAELVRSAEGDRRLDARFVELLLSRGLVEEALSYALAEREHAIAGLTAALRFLASGHRAEGTRLAEQWIAREKELVPRRWEMEASWVLLTEAILALPADCPDVVVERLAGGALALDVPPMDELLAGLEPRQRSRARKQLTTHAPELVQPNAPVMDNGRPPLGPAPQVQGSGKGTGANLVFLAFVAFLALFRFCMSSSEPAPRIDPSMFRPRVEANVPAQEGSPFARAIAERACMRSLASCEDLRVAARAMADEKRCDEAAEHLRAAATTDPLERDLLEPMEAELRRLCPETEPAMTPEVDGGSDGGSEP